MARRFSLCSILLFAALGGCAAPPANLATNLAANLALTPETHDGIPAAVSLPESTRPGPIPAGYIGFCLRYSDQCEVAKGAPAIVTLTPDNWALLNRVNHDLNNAITYEDDQKHYGIDEYWTIVTDGYGDCEDYALTKRKALLDAGLPAGALRIALVLTAKKERHALLTVATDRGDFVLDIDSDDVKPWTASSYVWLERQDPHQRWAWDRLNEDTTGGQAVAALVSR
jgi:predicted transglutaminase-like cysteine proteinase